MESGGTVRLHNAARSEAAALSDWEASKVARACLRIKQEIHFAFLINREAALIWIYCVKPKSSNALKVYMQKPEPEE